MKKITIALLIIIVVFFLSGCSNNENVESKKIKEEISYIDTRIITMLNKLNNIELQNYKINSNEIELQKEEKSESKGSEENSEDGAQEDSNNSENNQNKIEISNLTNNDILGNNADEIEWDEIKKDVEMVNESWNIIMLDLYRLNNSLKNIEKFSNSLNNSIVAIKNEDKLASIIALTNLYSYLPQLMRDSSQEIPQIEIKQTKAYILSAYSNANQGNWNQTIIDMTNAETEFIKVMNNLEFTKDKESKVNSVYLNIKELQNGLNIQDLNVFFIYYKNLLKEINKL